MIYAATWDPKELRQGDLLYGRFLTIPHAIRSLVDEFGAAFGEPTRKRAVSLQLVFDTTYFMVVSQCCEIEKEHQQVLLAQVVDASAVDTSALSREQRDAFHSNALGVELPTTAPTQVVVDDGPARPLQLVFPNYFFLPSPGEGHPRAGIANFALLRSVKGDEARKFTKIAELTIDGRRRLRRKLGMYFCRVPDVDYEPQRR